MCAVRRGKAALQKKIAVLLSPNMAEGDRALPDNVVQFRLTRKIPPPPQFQEISDSPSTWVAMEAEEQMTVSAGVIAEKMGLSVQEVDKLAYSIGVEWLLNYCLQRVLTPHENPPERKPSA